jgi:PHP family Zn ribbon phosphoesterase
MQSDRIHRDQLPPEPKNWREMKKHRCKDGFLEGAQREIQELTSKKTFKYIERPQGVQIIPLTWVFGYKLDTDGFLAKFKSRLCVRGDLL